MFRFPKRNPILRGVNFQLHAGQTTALFAPVGTGKSTLVELIQYFYFPELGRLSMPFLSEECTDLVNWRKQLGIVSQKEKLFNGTVLNNRLIILKKSKRQLTGAGTRRVFLSIPSRHPYDLWERRQKSIRRTTATGRISASLGQRAQNFDVG